MFVCRGVVCVRNLTRAMRHLYLSSCPNPETVDVNNCLCHEACHDMTGGCPRVSICCEKKFAPKFCFQVCL